VKWIEGYTDEWNLSGHKGRDEERQHKVPWKEVF